MSELGQHGAYLLRLTKQSLAHTARVYSASLEAAYPQLRLSRENLAKKETEILAVTAIETAINGGASFRELVTEFVAVASEMYKEDEKDAF